MAYKVCTCGNHLSTVSAPNDVQWRVYSDREWDSIIAMGQIDTFDIPTPTYDVWRCPKCDRIFVFQNGVNNLLKTYILEK
jgi:hypothetical protein